MIISRTPFRISFFGGGTDYPTWYLKHGGAVLSTAINKYCYITCRYLPPFFDHKYCIVYSRTEYCQTIEDIAHPAVREVIRFLKFDRGLEIHHDADLPARSGMGSSSAFTVGLLNGLYALKGQMVGKRRLAMESIHLEQDVLNETVGSQDQVLAAYGGFNHTVFFNNGEISVRPITITRDRMRELESHLMLFYTGIKRTASTVAETYVNGIDDRRRQLRAIKDMVQEGISILSEGHDIRAFGELLHEAWQLKASLSGSVSNARIDDVYAQARAGGAIGGKLTGAGGGGFLLLFAAPDTHDAILEKLRPLIHVPFNFDYTGSQIIFFGQEEDYEGEERSRSSNPVPAFEELMQGPGEADQIFASVLGERS